MYKALAGFISLFILAGCVNPKRLEPLPPIRSPDTSAQIFLKNMFTDKMDMRLLTFKLNGAPVYRFGETRQFSFYIDAGTYMLAFDHGSENCETEAYIRPKGNYVFELGPECRITMVSGE